MEPVGEDWALPKNLIEFCGDVSAFFGLSCLDRARRAPMLIEAAKSVFSDERSRAMIEARELYGVVLTAESLGISRAKVYKSINRTAKET